jgi:hypothetical protein
MIEAKTITRVGRRELLFSSHEALWVPQVPRFPVKLGGVGTLHSAFLNESRTSGPWIGQRTGNSGSRELT